MTPAKFLLRWIPLLLFALAAAGALYVATLGKAFAENAVVTWTHPTQRTDGSALPLAEIKATRIAYGKCPATDIVVEVAAPTATWSSPPLAYGEWCFRAATIDTLDMVSDFTLPVTKRIVAPPKPPVIVTVSTVVWEYKWHPVDGPMLGREVGTIPLGTACVGLDAQVPPAYFLVPRDAVTLTKRPKGDLIARCNVLEG